MKIVSYTGSKRIIHVPSAGKPFSSKKKVYKRNGEKIKQSCNNKETPEIGKENNSK